MKGESKLRQDFIKKEGRKTMIRKVKKRLHAREGHKLIYWQTAIQNCKGLHFSNWPLDCFNNKNDTFKEKPQ